MHEIMSRALLRGLDYRLIFSLQNCLLLCEKCHKRVHREWIEGFWYVLEGLEHVIAPGYVGVNANCAVTFRRVYR